MGQGIFSFRPARTLDRIVARLTRQPPAGEVSFWTFDDQAARRAAQALLAARGIRARFRSSYKPLVTFFREEVAPGFTAVSIGYPVHPAASPRRFLLEAYPLPALLSPVPVDFVPAPQDDHYTVSLTYPDRIQQHRVLAPNRLRRDATGAPQWSPCGWIRCEDPALSRPLRTDYERIFDAALGAVARRDWGAQEPFFEELNLAVTLPARDEPLGYGDEVLSLSEAMHEDLYFSLLEYFGRLTGRAAGDRRLRPGQIVPELRQGQPGLTISLRPWSRQDRDDAGDQQAGTDEAALAAVTRAPSVTRIGRILEAIGGDEFTARSGAGRIVRARHVQGRGAPVMITAGQHANETTPVMGALRAAMRLRREGAHFTISPLENPDGYALRGRLVRENPRHMHHAARYTVHGDDFAHRDATVPGEELDIRRQALARTGAGLHIDLHGYPAHEWTRPLSGYVPRGFAQWTIPKGLFLLLRHHAGWGDAASALLERVTGELARFPDLVAFNEAQLRWYRVHAEDMGCLWLNGFACFVTEDDHCATPMRLTAEYPDETLQGAAYVAGHEAQMRLVLAAHRAWQVVAPSSPQPFVAANTASDASIASL
ncbi:M14 family metallopeptidase [Paenirhodobacter populi]|uniref:peptidase M14 n=1 Tax=Paenirhodobacter populi TaxID=2306993 RepID=UPI0019D4DFF1|nr:peptidase M14 [Sinirhodobacter populi]